MNPLSYEVDALRSGLSFLVPFARSSKSRLTSIDLPRFSGDTLFDHVGRAVCAAGCLPRKELYEAWETARRVRRLFRGGRIVDLAAGHGLLGQLMLILDDSSQAAIAVDAVIPPSAETLHRTLVERWPRLERRIVFETSRIEQFELLPADVVVSIHACGALTDVVLERAAAVRARVAVLPCCHDASSPDAEVLNGWIDASLAIDVTRATRLTGRGYRIWTQHIPEEITAKNRLLIGTPREELASGEWRG